ncbi:MAG: GTPase ObgE [Candidatus Dormibacteria bacterium]
MEVAGGDGGRGAVSFRREKYVPRGGPDGGDGGRGGEVALLADATDTTLAPFRDRRRFQAAAGGPGARNLRHGAAGEDMVISVPPGTVVRDAASGEVIADLQRRGMRVVVARGGRGGRGNSHFASATRQSPRIGELGARGERRRLHLELKLIADVGLVGLPNAGKSTLLAALTGAHPKIAPYPFTTLSPNLGVAESGSGTSLVVADVPGLVEGAHRGVGLGTDFLRHLERTRVLLHVVDASAGEDEVERAIAAVLGELSAFSAALAQRPRLLVFNKEDLITPERRSDLRRRHPGARFIAAAEWRGTTALLEEAITLLAAAPVAGTAVPATPDTGEHRIYRHQPRRVAPVVSRQGGVLVVTSPAAERRVAMTDMDSEEAVARLQRWLRGAGVDQALAAAGAVDGDTVRIGELEFVYADDS